MSQIHAMSDDQVNNELKKMTAFIRQEALEKAREIQLKADEEFAIEKSRLVRQETAAIDTAYEKKFKQAGMNQQITRSTMANKTRLRILTARQETLDELFDQARGRLGDFTKGKGNSKGPSYEEILKNLILEGLYALNEPKVAIRARKQDADVVKKAAEAAAKEYKESMGKESEPQLDEKNVLPEGITGGVSILGSQGRIEINNTFEERLKLLEDDGLPQIRNQMFGENKNRRFKD